LGRQFQKLVVGYAAPEEHGKPRCQFIVGQFIDTLFPDADTADFEGTLVVEVTGGTVAATALELGTSAG
jgi:hypothetical protein